MSHQSRRTIGAALLGVAALLLGLLFFARSRTRGVTAVQTDEPALGAPNAPVTIIEYGDFGCPACQVWHQAGIRERVLAQYEGQVRFVWRDLAIITPMSGRAAEAARCAHDQGAFWAYHDRLFERTPAIREQDLKTYAAELGLDTGQFNACLDSGQHRATVYEQYQEAKELRLRATPSFLVNGEPLPAPPSFGYLQEVIEEELSPN